MAKPTGSAKAISKCTKLYRGEISFILSAIQRYAPPARSDQCCKHIDRVFGKRFGKRASELGPEYVALKKYFPRHSIEPLVAKLCNMIEGQKVARTRS